MNPMDQDEFSRRAFLKTTALTTAGIAMSASLSAKADDAAASSNAPTLPRREFGNTGIKLSIVGMERHRRAGRPNRSTPVVSWRSSSNAA